jgi:hypothetical protein
MIRRTSFITVLVFMAFFSLSLGNQAALFLKGSFANGFWSEGTYFLCILSAAFALVLGGAVSAIFGARFTTCILYSFSWLALFCGTAILCIPRFWDGTIPFVFNLLFSIVASLILATPDMVLLIENRRASR